MKELKLISEIISGYPFRSALPDAQIGQVLAVQLRDVTEDHKIDWSSVTRTDFPKNARRKANYLKNGDIIFSSKGKHFRANLIDNCPENAVCTPHFFHIRLDKPNQILPEYLVWYLNQDSIQNEITKTTGSVALTTIRKEMIQTISVIIPPLNIQKKLLSLEDLYQQERVHLEKMIENRQQSLTWVNQNIFRKYQDDED